MEEKDKNKFKQMDKLTEVDWEKFKKTPYPKKKDKDNSLNEKESQLFLITLKHNGSLG